MLKVTPLAEHLNGQAFCTAEIDAHPDAARIWATLKEYHNNLCDELLTEEYGWEDHIV